MKRQKTLLLLIALTITWGCIEQAGYGLLGPPGHINATSTEYIFDKSTGIIKVTCYNELGYPIKESIRQYKHIPHLGKNVFAVVTADSPRTQIWSVSEELAKQLHMVIREGEKRPNPVFTMHM